MKIWADTESLGLIVPKTFQWVDEKISPPQITYLFKNWNFDPGQILARIQAEEFINRLYDPGTTLYLFNAPHDLSIFYRMKLMLDGFSLDSRQGREQLKPFLCKVIDLQLHAMVKSPLAPFAFSKSGGRSVARVCRIPKAVKEDVIKEVLPSLRTVVPENLPIVYSEHEVKGHPEQVTLSFRVDSRLSLKGLMKFYGVPTIPIVEVWPLPAKGEEKTYLPYPQPVHDRLEPLCDEIMSDKRAGFHTYAKLDPLFTKFLWEKLGCPEEPNDNDDCAAAVAYARERGFSYDKEILEDTAVYYRKKIHRAAKVLEGINLKSSKQRLELLQKYDPLIQTSKKAVVEVLARSDRPCAKAAKAILNFGMYSQRLNQVEKLLECKTGMMHAELRVMGTATNRMAGAGSFNVQGIAQAQQVGKKKLGIRAAIELSSGGDFDSLEVNIAGYAYDDKQLQEDMVNKIDLHMMTGTLVSPLIKGMDYAEAMKIKKEENHKQHKIVIEARKWHGKRTVFSIMYGCTIKKIMEILGCLEIEAEQALNRFFGRYSGIKNWRDQNEREVCTADVENWTIDSIRHMKRSVVSLFGYERRFDFEASVADIMWKLGQRGVRLSQEGMIVRSKEKGLQPYHQAVRSACLGAAISIQKAVARQRANAPIQISGSECCKNLMSRLWRRFRLPLLNIHDELLSAKMTLPEGIDEEVENFLAEKRKIIPTLSIKIVPMAHWSDKE